MIKVENDMLVLDNSFTRDDVQAIYEFVKINVDKERERIIKLLEDNAMIEDLYSVGYYESDPLIYLDVAISLIRGNDEEVS